MFDRFFVSRRRFDEMTAARDDFRQGYMDELSKRLRAGDLVADLRGSLMRSSIRSTKLAMRVDQLTAVLRHSHYRDPATGKIGAKGDYPILKQEVF